MAQDEDNKRAPSTTGPTGLRAKAKRPGAGEALAEADDQDSKDVAYEELRARLKLLNITPLQARKLTDAQILEKADKEARLMLLEALAIKKHGLRYGSDKLKNEIASEVIEMNGMARKDAIVGGGGSIVINIGAGTAPSWFRKESPVPAGNIVDVEPKK